MGALLEPNLCSRRPGLNHRISLFPVYLGSLMLLLVPLLQYTE